MLIEFIGYLVFPKTSVVFTERTASTANLAKISDSLPIIFEDIEVLAQLTKASLPKLETSIEILSFKNLQASLAAIL